MSTITMPITIHLPGQVSRQATAATTSEKTPTIAANKAQKASKTQRRRPPSSFLRRPTMPIMNSSGKIEKKKENNKPMGNNLFVKNFQQELNDITLRKLFASYGMIISCTVIKNEDGISKGYGFVCFDQPSNAKNALTAMQGHVLESGRPLYVGWAQKKGEREKALKELFEGKERQQVSVENIYAPHLLVDDGCTQSRNLFVSNLTPNVTGAILAKVFSRCGSVNKCKVPLGRTYGFVEFADPKSASQAIHHFNGRVQPCGRSLKVAYDISSTNTQAPNNSLLNISQDSDTTSNDTFLSSIWPTETKKKSKDEVKLNVEKESVTDEVASLRRQLQNFEISLQCVVCCASTADLVFQCGHRSCESCSKLLSECPQCRVKITSKIKTYL